jgi:hypothetical protein
MKVNGYSFVIGNETSRVNITFNWKSELPTNDIGLTIDCYHNRCLEQVQKCSLDSNSFKLAKNEMTVAGAFLLSVLVICLIYFACLADKGVEIYITTYRRIKKQTNNGVMLVE